MPQTALGITYPDGTSVHPSANWYQEMATTTDAAVQTYVADESLQRGPIADGTDLNTVQTPGFWSVESSTSAGTLINAPSSAGTGVVLVTSTANGNVQQQYITTGHSATVWLRGLSSVGSQTWGAWRDMSKDAVTVLTSGTDLNTLDIAGVYVAQSTGVASSLVNAPDGLPGVLEVLALTGDLTVQRWTSTLSTGQAWWRATVSTSSGNFTPWRDMAATDSGAYSHTDLLSRARMRRGGRIGTAGLGAVALRFDHHLDSFQTKVLPLLIELDLPWAQAINPENIGTGDDNMTYAALQAACLDHGGEIWNHGGDHGDATNPITLDAQITGSLATLQANLPALAIEGWAPPGLADGGYMGASPFKTTAQNTETYAGRLIMGNHAFVAGYADGQYRILDPTVQPIGGPHVTIDEAALSSLTSVLNQVAGRGVGCAFMLHSNYLDQPGYLTTADLEAFLADIAARRDAGTVQVLSYSGLWVADIDSTRRQDLAPVIPPTGLIAAESLTVNVPWFRADQHYGAPREVLVEVTAASATTLTIAVGDRPSTTHTVPTGTSTIRRIITLPADLVGTAPLPLVITPAAALTVADVSVLAV